MKIEIEYKDGKIHVTVHKPNAVSQHFAAKSSETKAQVIFACIMKTAAELFNTVKD